MRTLRLGVLGCGTVGGGLVELIRRNRAVVADRTGVDLEVRRVLIRDPKKERPVEPALLTTDPDAVLEAPDIDMVVELIGGVDPARTFITRAVEAGKNVVTANKALLAEAGVELIRRAADRRVRLGFEASVCGGIPILKAIGAGLVGNRISALVAIVNGTCNFILTRMTEEKVDFASALAEAQRLGFAEADPTLDVDGIDSAQKLQILAQLAFGVNHPHSEFLVEGIRSLEPDDIRTAAELGYVIKLVAIGRDLGDSLDLRVHPALLPTVHPLAHIRNEFNSVLLRGDAVDEMIFTGKGAGSLPTASAVLSDIIEIARNGHGNKELPWHLAKPVDKPVATDLESKYYLRFPVRDVPGVIGLIATALGNRGISISHASADLAQGREGQGQVKILAHRTRESAVRKAIEEITRLPILSGRPVILRLFEDMIK